MKVSDLTEAAGNASNALVNKRGGASTMQGQAKCNWRVIMPSAVLGPALLVLSGCINLTAPTDPIVITLNINIEVTARLVEDASEAIDENADIF